MKLNSKALGVVLLVVFFGGIALSIGLGTWQTKSSKQPTRFRGGDAAGEYNPADIRGSYTFGDVSELFEVPLEDLIRAFDLEDEENAPDLRVSMLEERYAGLVEEGEVGTSSVRLFVAWYKGLPYTPSGDEYLLMPSARILKSVATLTDEQITYLESHSLTPSSGQSGSGQGPAEGEEDHEPPDDQVVRGKTTFRDLLEWGLTEERIESVLGLEMPQPLLTVRDFCVDNGLPFGEIKVELQTLIDED